MELGRPQGRELLPSSTGSSSLFPLRGEFLSKLRLSGQAFLTALRLSGRGLYFVYLLFTTSGDVFRLSL